MEDKVILKCQRWMGSLIEVLFYGLRFHPQAEDASGHSSQSYTNCTRRLELLPEEDCGGSCRCGGGVSYAGI